MAMVEVPGGGSAVGGRLGEEQSRPPHNTLFSRGPPRKSPEKNSRHYGKYPIHISCSHGG
eukprot:scaffold9618_cov41-Cyclotella_meneghiniana.AAC.3